MDESLSIQIRTPSSSSVQTKATDVLVVYDVGVACWSVKVRRSVTPSRPASGWHWPATTVDVGLGVGDGVALLAAEGDVSAAADSVSPEPQPARTTAAYRGGGRGDLAAEFASDANSEQLLFRQAVEKVP